MSSHPSAPPPDNDGAAGGFSDPSRTGPRPGLVPDDRERIADDLHEHVIQQLFATGLVLQSVATQLGPGRLTEQVLAAVDDLDDTINRIRSSVLALRDPPPQQ
jgi:signal transduction histidine kinase